MPFTFSYGWTCGEGRQLTTGPWRPDLSSLSLSHTECISLQLTIHSPLFFSAHMTTKASVDLVDLYRWPWTSLRVWHAWVALFVPSCLENAATLEVSNKQAQISPWGLVRNYGARNSRLIVSNCRLVLFTIFSYVITEYHPRSFITTQAEILVMIGKRDICRSVYYWTEFCKNNQTLWIEIHSYKTK